MSNYEFSLGKIYVRYGKKASFIEVRRVIKGNSRACCGNIDSTKLFDDNKYIKYSQLSYKKNATKHFISSLIYFILRCL